MNDPMRTSTARTPVRVIPVVALTTRALIVGDEIGCHARCRVRRDRPRPERGERRIQCKPGHVELPLSATWAIGSIRVQPFPHAIPQSVDEDRIPVPQSVCRNTSIGLIGA